MTDVNAFLSAIPIRVLADAYRTRNVSMDHSVGGWHPTTLCHRVPRIGHERLYEIADGIAQTVITPGIVRSFLNAQGGAKTASNGRKARQLKAGFRGHGKKKLRWSTRQGRIDEKETLDSEDSPV